LYRLGRLLNYQRTGLNHPFISLPFICKLMYFKSKK
jgi:hypothetical protein